MEFIADFHIHSHYSRATSKLLTLEYLELWAKIKGINVIGTGDCVHPGWLRELKERLEPSGNGLFRLKEEFRLKDNAAPSGASIPGEVFFMLTGEISNIYKKAGAVRKVHNLCVFPDFEAVEKLQSRLVKIGNLASDGRPILGMDSRLLLEMTLESSGSSFLIPAHIWTPWFSLLGSKSGFDTPEECYGDLTPYIFAVETGLSSDPPMNRACGFLDRFKLVSNSDAHSPEKLGREANLFDCELSYDGIYNALKGEKGFLGTIEFFPQEGKYHYDGHRKCNVKWDPLETIAHKGVCPVCGKPVTMGVMYRVAELADRREREAVDTNGFFSITSLPDLLAEVMGYKNSSGKAVRKEYMRLIQRVGSEFHILLNAVPEEIKKAGGELLAEGIRRLRNSEVIIEEGFDGEFGRVKVFDKGETRDFSGNTRFLFDHSTPPQKNRQRKSIEFDIREFKSLLQKKSSTTPSAGKKTARETRETIADEQQEAIEHYHGPCMVIAGPGSGKTTVLTKRIHHLVTARKVKAGRILAVTFSNRAAGEIKERLVTKSCSLETDVLTFHAFGLSVLREFHKKWGRTGDFSILDDEGKRDKQFKTISSYKQGLVSGEKAAALVMAYNRVLAEKNAFDLDDLICLPVILFRENPDIAARYRKKYPWILVDEFQDINARQYELIRLLAGDGKPNIFVIGDPDQAIYGFRGSDVRFIKKLREDYPSLKTIGLKKSYRCPGQVLKIGGQVLKKREFLAGKTAEVKIHIQRTTTEKSEADWIAARIEQMMGGVRSFSIDSGISDGEAMEGAAGFSDFCVLCRTTSMFDPFIKAFEDHGIAYQATGSTSFYRKEPLSSIIKEIRDIYNKDAHTPLTDILVELMKERGVPALDRKRMERLAGDFGNDYGRFFTALAMRQGIDDFDERAEAVSLMTLHASKGLEFNAVFIPGCEKGVIPFELFGKKSKEELLEEERLFYVGVTRTKKYLFLTHADKRFIRGKVVDQGRSPLLDRLEKGLLTVETRQPGKMVKDDPQLSLFSE